MTPNDFEILVYKIFDLIKLAGATVEHNVMVEHPDGVGSRRQVDALITLNGKRIFIECRLRYGKHGKPRKQGSMWIDSLKGKKEIYKADKIIGVSASGFTKPAEKLANHEGIQLFDLATLTDVDVLDSMLKPTISIIWLKFTELTFYFGLPIKKGNKPPSQEEAFDLLHSQDLSHEIIKMIANDQNINVADWPLNKAFKLQTDLSIPSRPTFTIGEWEFQSLIVEAILQKVETDLEDYELKLFGPAGQKERVIGIHDFDKIYLIDTPIKGCLITDFSNIKPPLNHYYLGATFKALDPGKLYDIYTKNTPVQFRDLFQIKLAFQIYEPK